jgi:hypothetical protein
MNTDQHVQQTDTIGGGIESNGNKPIIGIFN